MLWRLRRPYLLHLARSPSLSRQFSAVKFERVGIECRPNTRITLDLFPSSSTSSPILIYLPSGPILPDQTDEQDRVISLLARSSGAMVARINYRLSPTYQFPMPIHDVLLGYDWIVENLVRGETSSQSSRPIIKRVGVCGELVGGSLATMLALTECRLGEPRIGAAAVNNPVVDWVFSEDLPESLPAGLPEPNAPKETSSPADGDQMTWWEQQDEQKSYEMIEKRSKKVTKSPPKTSWMYNGDNRLLLTLTLSGKRDVLFRRSEDFFDRFASPIHFFRSPRAKLIYPQHDNTLASSSPSNVPVDPLDFETRQEILHHQSLQALPPALELPTLVKCRAYARIYPPSNSDLSLPRCMITAGLGSPLLDQCSELAKLMRRSVARQRVKSRTGRAHWQNEAEKARYDEFAHKIVQFNSVEGVGLWTQSDSNPNWRPDVENVGSWLKESLSS
ncbi:alpha/beta-hydrolase [Lojkania enalia]|uniref:Alpha/beta-hydrolase n=1 Tax=Lojkania enalia TaxID=147567 RepID=A0A9P4NAM1_9PLEO|nr:alpha/beta-hydrolase [Didymosphaeria enalia]